MCGFAGFLGQGDWMHNGAVPTVLRRMADAIRSRGPDDSGIWHGDAGIGLAHRRLSIVDLSAAGHQPMTCHSGRFVMAFNGEIYNHLELRRELQASGLAPAWRGHSDSESLLACFTAWGVRATVERCVGMFAFSLWDRKDRVLHLGRDRLGEKPLYYGWLGQGAAACFLFGSELKALRTHPAFVAEIDRGALRLLMRYGYITAPHSIYQGIFKVPPGHLITVSDTCREPQIEAYWSLSDVAQRGAAEPLRGDSRQVGDQLETLLMSAVRQQMVADVPLGAFLSGGIDSSAIVALMQAQSSRPIKTFSIGFHEEGYDEAVHAKAVARHLGTDHTELYVTAQQSLDVIPRLAHLYCEPFADASQIPTFLVSQLARQQVTVSLSGDGGDELFGGYSRYTLAGDAWRRVARLPYGMRQSMAAMILALPPNGWNALLRPTRALQPHFMRVANPGDRLHKGASLLSARNVDELYKGLMTHWEPDDVVLGGLEPVTCHDGGTLRLPPGLAPMERLMALDSATYLPDDILVKVDRAAMGVSLETRVPFLDHRVFEFAWHIPQSMKMCQGQSKWILRQVLYRHVPEKIVDRPKMGFGVPIDVWLRGPLRGWAESLLSEARLRREGYFNPAPIRRKWGEHLAGLRNWQYPLWDVLMFQAWLEDQGTYTP